MEKKHQSSARRYRPQRFADVVGQGAVLTTLQNALRLNQIAHAYLFCGSRGVGKTTLARLFAKALNCPNRQSDMEPCNECPSCLEIASGQSLDVIEIDGASNRGIDDIRQINETVGYAPSHGLYKIYIIDEVHMLTKEAFNALLKTLEEPPEKAKFFFATTEPHKVLPTIISRCQRFDLLRIGPNQIFEKLSQIAQDAQRIVEPGALHLIASFADGSLRDAESLFDQILCFASATVTDETVRDALGLLSEEHFFTLDQAFSECRLPYAFELIDRLFQSGKDLSHFFEQLVEHYRRIALVKTVGEKGLPPHLSASYGSTARLYTQGQSLYILEMLIHTESQMQKSALPRVTLESTLLHIIRSKNRVPLEVIARRLSELEETLKKTPDASIHIEEPSKMVAAPQPPETETPAPMQHIKTVLIPTPLPPAPQLEESYAPMEPIKTVHIETPLCSAPHSEEPDAPTQTMEPPVLAETALPKPPIEAAPVVEKHLGHFETVMRFAAVELEGKLVK